MNIRAVKKMIDEGEGFELEFKRKVSSPEKIAKTLCAFANTRGGVLLFGVDDDGRIVGVESEKAEIELVRHAGETLCDPAVPITVEFVPYHHRDVMVVSVEESDSKPHWVTENGDGKNVYIRVHDNTVIASREVIKVLKDETSEKSLTLSIGKNEKRLFEYLDEHRRITVGDYAAMINVSARRASRILTTLVRAGVVRIHTMEKSEYFTLASNDAKSLHSQK